MPKGNPIEQGYITVAERIEKFYEKHLNGRIITHIVEHDAERGFILMRAEVFRNHDDSVPAASGHAFEFKLEGFVNRTSYIENCETSCVGRALAILGFEIKRGIASQEEMNKVRRHQSDSNGVKLDSHQHATEAQKQDILDLLETLRPGDRRAQRNMLVEMTGKESRDDLSQEEAQKLIERLKHEKV